MIQEDQKIIIQNKQSHHISDIILNLSNSTENKRGAPPSKNQIHLKHKQSVNNANNNEQDSNLKIGLDKKNQFHKLLKLKNNIIGQMNPKNKNAFSNNNLAYNNYNNNQKISHHPVSHSQRQKIHRRLFKNSFNAFSSRKRNLYHNQLTNELRIGSRSSNASPAHLYVGKNEIQVPNVQQIY